VIISIHQPDYIPYWGYFYKILKADIFVFLDDVQFSNNNMHHWNRIKTPQGECRLKVPVEYRFGDKINQVRPKDELKWKEKHLRTIEMNYARADFFKEIYPSYKGILCSDYKTLADMNIAINSFICKFLGITPKFIRSSELNISTAKEERVIDICLALGGTEYISGNGAQAYQSESHFTERGVKLVYTDYYPFAYKQLWREFLPNISILDYLFNCGFVNPYKND